MMARMCGAHAVVSDERLCAMAGSFHLKKKVTFLETLGVYPIYAICYVLKSILLLCCRLQKKVSTTAI